MKCPLCDSTAHLEIDLHSDGYCQDALECGDCGGIWTFFENELKIIKDRREERAKDFSDFICPAC